MRTELPGGPTRGPVDMGCQGNVIVIIQRRRLTSVHPLEGCIIEQSHAELGGRDLFAWETPEEWLSVLCCSVSLLL